MNINNPYSIYHDTIKKFGKEVQLIICIEELSELIKSISKYNRAKLLGKPNNLKSIIEETADSIIMIEQVIYMFQIYGDVQKEKEIKLERLKELINES